MLTQKPFSSFDPTRYSVICVGAGFAGSVFAREMAEKMGYRVAILERRPHIGGNAYDERNEAGVLVHTYGPHIFHTDNRRVYDYLSRFTEWLPYEHRVLANVHGTLMPVPFNRTGLSIAFGSEEGERYYRMLVSKFGEGTKVRLSELMALGDSELSRVVDYVYNNIFLYYTQKQWGKTPDEIDPQVTGRVPIYLSDDDRYFQDAYQGMPKDGYTALFENLLNHDLIDVFTSVDARDVLRIQDGRLYVGDSYFPGIVLYTGALDELFEREYGALPYRTLDMVFETLAQDEFQPAATVNYTTTEDFTRITEFKHMTGDKNVPELTGVTTILKEYPQAYDPDSDMTPYYPIFEEKSKHRYERYRNLADSVAGLYVLGRLAEYRYYDMDDVVEAALFFADDLVEQLR